MGVEEDADLSYVYFTYHPISQRKEEIYIDFKDGIFLGSGANVSSPDYS